MKQLGNNQNMSFHIHHLWEIHIKAKMIHFAAS